LQHVRFALHQVAGSKEAAARKLIEAEGGPSPIAGRRVIVSRRLIDGGLERWVVSTDDIRLGLAPDPEVEAEDVIDAIGLH
jgi:hypothetical protein